MRAGSFVFLFIVICLVMGHTNGVRKLEERYSWKQLDFAFPNRALKQRAFTSGDYIPTNSFPMSIEHWGNKLFVTVPRWNESIPATLTYIDTTKTPSGSPELIPYPDWASNTIGDCLNGLTTIYAIKADKCGRLWVHDAGDIGIGKKALRLCPEALNVFDLSTNTRIRRYELRPEDKNAKTFIANIAVDIGRNCDDTFVYLADDVGFGLIVYSWEQNKSWRFENSYFFPDPLRIDYNIAGLNYQWQDGIFGMALSGIQNDGYRTFYFSPLGSHREFFVSTRILRDSERVIDSFHDFFYKEERGPNSRTTSQIMDDDGLMLFNLVDQNAVGCWHSSLPYTPQYHGIVDRDDVGLVFPSDLKIDEDRNVWVISNRLPVFLITRYDFNDVNFRIYTAPLDKLIAGTVCDVREPLYNRFDVIKPKQKTAAVNDYVPRQSASRSPSPLLRTTPKGQLFTKYNEASMETALHYSFGGVGYQSIISYPDNNSSRKNNHW